MVYFSNGGVSMLRPGTTVSYNGERGTVERHAGGGDVIVRTRKGRFVVNERVLRVVAPSITSSIPIVTPEEPGVTPEEPTDDELRARLEAAGFEVSEDVTREEMLEALDE